MSVFDILTMIGGLALFLYGMEVMGNGLSKASLGRGARACATDPTTVRRVYDGPSSGSRSEYQRQNCRYPKQPQ